MTVPWISEVHDDSDAPLDALNAFAIVETTTTGSRISGVGGRTVPSCMVSLGDARIGCNRGVLQHRR